MNYEAQFKAKIKKTVKCYCLATAERFTRGVPDHWYSGLKGDLWIEYKWDRTNKTLRPKLTVLQRRWLDDRWAEGRNVAVIVATSLSSGIIYVDGEWNSSKPVNSAQPFSELVAFIESHTLLPPHAVSSNNDVRKRPTRSRPRTRIRHPDDRDQRISSADQPPPPPRGFTQDR